MLFHAGVVNESPAEFDAINFVVNNKHNLNSTSIVLKNFNVSGKRDLYKQGKISQKEQNLLWLNFCFYTYIAEN